jgi:hypothetical protein
LKWKDSILLLEKNPNRNTTKFSLCPHSVFLAYESHSNAGTEYWLMALHCYGGLSDAAGTARNVEYTELALELEHQD